MGLSSLTDSPRCCEEELLPARGPTWGLGRQTDNVTVTVVARRWGA